MNNPAPIKRARRLEVRRKYLGGGEPRCLYCPESSIPCLELDHPVGEHRDVEFKQVVCRNCHRKIELERDLAGLTKNGLHDTSETPRQSSRSYLLLQAMHLEGLGDLLESTPGAAQAVATEAEDGSARCSAHLEADAEG